VTTSGEEGAPRSDAAAPKMVRREVRDFLRAHEQRRRQLPRALLVGVIAGVVAVAFRAALIAADALRDQLIAHVQAHPLLFPLPPLYAAAGAAAAVYLVKRFAPETSGSGIPHVKAVLHGLRRMAWPRVLAVKFFAGVAGIGAGLALGREGPTIQMGAAIGQMVSGWFRSTPRETRTLIAAGAGAGLAAAFNAPLAGLVFVLEEVQRDFSPGVFTVTLIASGVADVTTRLLLGQLPVFHVEAQSIPPLPSIPFGVLLGGVAGGLGVLFNRCLVWTLDRFETLRDRPAWIVGGSVGLAVGTIAIFAPGAVGGGNRLVERTIAGDVSAAALPLFFLLRFVLTMASYGCGAPGGIFAPLLVLGSEVGLGVGKATARFFPDVPDYARTFAVVGMAAYFTAIVRAPLTGIVLMVEMTGNYGLVLPLLAACLAAYGLADLLRDRPVYEALLERDLLRGHEDTAARGSLVIDLTVASGSPFDGTLVRDLGLPRGCLVITVRRGLTEHVATADTRIAAGDQITIVVDSNAASAVALLRKGAGMDPE
jgi:CIC family chloride channel protein